MDFFAIEKGGKMGITYKSAGVDILEANRAKKMFTSFVEATFNVSGVRVTKFGQFTGIVFF
jgi:phosphoribosylaminoimidazole (AIR) synthetase